MLLGMMILTGMQACETTPGEGSDFSISDAKENRNVVPLPYKEFGKGVFVVDIGVANLGPRPFLLDTGATRSAVFEDLAKELALVPQGQEAVMVHGMTAKDLKQRSTIESMSVGPHVYQDVSVVILSERKDKPADKVLPQGLIGMDILSKFRLYVDGPEKMIYLIPVSLPELKPPPYWRKIQLIKNPYSETDYGLHFFEMRVGNKLVPALFDSGSEINIVNWNSVHFPQLKSMRRRLREKWVIDGAVGEFDPVTVVNMQNFRSGQKRWDKREFYVMDFDNLGILGVESQPFIIAGANLFAGGSFYVDFETDQLIVRPTEVDREFMLGSPTGISILVE